MAGYCGYCGTPLDKNGLCPNCGNEDEATGLLTPADMPAFYTEGQGALFGGGPASDAEPEQTPYSYPVVDPRPTLDVPPVYPGSGYGAQQGYARQDPALGVAYAAPQPEKQPKRATPKKPSKGGRGKKIALIAGSCVLGVALIVGLLFAFGVIRLKSDPLVGEVYFLVTPAEHIQTDADTGLRYADNELLVVARTGVKKRDMETVAKKYHAAVVGFIEVTGDYQLQLEEPLSKDDLEQLSVTIASEPEIASAEPNRVVTLRRTAAAPANETSETPAATPETYWNLRQIRAYEAWTTVNAHKNEIKPVPIGMIADGAPAGHKDIPLKESFFASNGDVGHALAVAGIMAADGTNEDGFSGVYPYASGRLYAASTEGMGTDGVSVMWEKAAIAKLLVSGVKVLNCGYGTEMTDFLDLTAAADTLGDYLNRSLNAGYDFLLVAPASDTAGDSTLNAIDKAKYPNVRAHILTTGGSDEDGQPLASGAHDLLAPQGRETAIYSAVPGGYGFVGNDASLAAPHVSGAAALVWSVDENLTGDAVRRILIHTAQANRLLDVNAAVTFALENKGKDVPAGNDPDEPTAEAQPEPEKIPTPALSPEEAVEIYMANKDVWFWSGEYAPMYGVTYLFVDFDGDGILEMIVNACDGTVRISSNSFYAIDPAAGKVVALDSKSSTDFTVDPVMLRGKDHNEIAYYCQDYMGGASFQEYFLAYSLLLQSNSGIEEQRAPYSYYHCGQGMIGNAEEINEYTLGGPDSEEKTDEAGFEKAKETFLSDYTDLHATVPSFMDAELEKKSAAEQRQILLDAYRSFSYDGFSFDDYSFEESQTGEPTSQQEPETTQPPTTQPQPSAENLEATDADLQDLGQSFDNYESLLSDLCMTLPNVDPDNYRHFTVSFDTAAQHGGNPAYDLFYVTFSPICDHYFGAPDYGTYTDETNPFHNSYPTYQYVKYPLDRLSWVAERVLNYDGFTAEDFASMSEQAGNLSAVIDGCLCIESIPFGITELIRARIDSTERQADGTYRFTVLFQYEDPDGVKDCSGVGTLIAAVREDSGRRYWSILKFDADVTF